MPLFHGICWNTTKKKKGIWRYPDRCRRTPLGEHRADIVLFALFSECMCLLCRTEKHGLPESVHLLKIGLCHYRNFVTKTEKEAIMVCEPTVIQPSQCWRAQCAYYSYLHYTMDHAYREAARGHQITAFLRAVLGLVALFLVVGPSIYC